MFFFNLNWKIKKQIGKVTILRRHYNSGETFTLKSFFRKQTNRLEDYPFKDYTALTHSPKDF